jgi:hypothetical protein
MCEREPEVSSPSSADSGLPMVSSPLGEAMELLPGRRNSPNDDDDRCT